MSIIGEMHAERKGEGGRWWWWWDERAIKNDNVEWMTNDYFCVLRHERSS